MLNKGMLWLFSCARGATLSGVLTLELKLPGDADARRRFRLEASGIARSRPTSRVVPNCLNCLMTYVFSEELSISCAWHPGARVDDKSQLTSAPGCAATLYPRGAVRGEGRGTAVVSAPMSVLAQSPSRASPWGRRRAPALDTPRRAVDLRRHAHGGSQGDCAGLRGSPRTAT